MMYSPPKNFSYLMDHQGQWTLSPAYDLTFSFGPRGEQSTMVMGEGKNPRVNHLIKLGKEAQLKPQHIMDIIDQTKASLNQWPSLAKTHGVSANNIKIIKDKISQLQS